MQKLHWLVEKFDEQRTYKLTHQANRQCAAGESKLLVHQVLWNCFINSAGTRTWERIADVLETSLVWLSPSVVLYSVFCCTSCMTSLAKNPGPQRHYHLIFLLLVSCQAKRGAAIAIPNLLCLIRRSHLFLAPVPHLTSCLCSEPEQVIIEAPVP